MVNPLLDPEVSLDDVFQGYIEASKDTSRIKSKFITYDDHQKQKAKKSKRDLAKQEKSESGWFKIRYIRGSYVKEELDVEQASMMGHRVIV